MAARRKRGVPVFNCFIWDDNADKMEAYNIFEYLDREYRYTKTHKGYSKVYPLPTNFEEAKKWCEDKLLYQFWCRCEYEWIAYSLVDKEKDEKIDIYQEAMMNIDIIAKMFMEHYML